MPKQTLEAITALARKHSLILFADEVYRPLFHSISPLSPFFPPSVLSLDYDNVMVTGSLSKAYSLAGIRTGWLASRSSALLEACMQARDYTTISVSQISDQIASFALSPECVHRLLGRNIDLAKTNLDLLAKFVEEYQERGTCKWIKPLAGTTAFVKFLRNGKAVNDVAFCQMLFDKTGVMVVPGGLCFGNGKDFQGYVRVGFVCETEVLRDGLKMFRDFMKNDFEGVPVVEESE